MRKSKFQSPSPTVDYDVARYNHKPDACTLPFSVSFCSVSNMHTKRYCLDPVARVQGMCRHIAVSQPAQVCDNL